MRRFRKGRVDNIRAATPEALRWVMSMSDTCKTVVPFKSIFGILKIACIPFFGEHFYFKNSAKTITNSIHMQYVE